jgi:1,4-alpha-glucan branching enzyme
MPFNEFEGNLSWGYNSSFYFAPDKYYGTKNAIKRFVDSCHSKGIAVIMDIALNHQFGQSPMVQLYWDAANNRPAANSPWFNVAPKHPFNVGYDMNHESLDTRYFTSRVVEHWLSEYKIDGYRFDLSKGFTQVASCDANGNNCNQGTWDAYDVTRINIWKRYYDTVQTKSPNAYVILEHLGVNQEETEMANYGMMFWGNLNNAYKQAAKANPSNWDLSWGFSSVRGFANRHLVTYMESHDEERIVRAAITEGSASASYNTRDTTTALKRMELDAALFFTIPGPKMIWQFGELGYPYSINTCENGSVSNDCRLANKPIRWDYLNDPRRKSVYNTYSSLINLRFHPWYRQAFITGSVDQNTNAAVKWIKVSSGDSSHLLVVGNFDIIPQTATVTFQTPGTFFDYFNNVTFTATGSAQSIVLQPGEYRLFLNRNVNNIATTALPAVPNPGAARLQASVYPNPIREGFTLKVELPQSGMTTVDLYNTTGQLVGTVYQQVTASGSRQLYIDRPSVPSGTYFLRVAHKSGTATIPVTIQ